jgi:hypothetical protein
LWATDPGGDNVTGYAVSADNSGNSYITGLLSNDTATFGNYFLLSAGADYNGAYNVVTAKFDPLGHIAWARTDGGTGNDQGNAISSDAYGNCYTTGEFASAVSMFGSYSLVNTAVWTNVFVAKYDTSGNVLWAKSAGGTSYGEGSINYTSGTGIGTDAGGNSYVTGGFYSKTMKFGNITLTNTDEQYNFDKFFIVKYDPDGNVLWAQCPQSTGWSAGEAISTDAYGNSYVTGGFYDTLILANDTLINSAGGEAIFVAKYDPSGNVVWAANTNTWQTILGYLAIAANNNNECYITSAFGTGKLAFGTDTLTNTDSASFNMFLVKYGPSGQVLWAMQPGGSVPGGYTDMGKSISTDAYDNCYVAGSFTTPTLILGNDTLNNKAALNIYNGNIFVGKLGNACNLNGPAITADKPVFCANDSTQICAPAGYTSYAWNAGGTDSCMLTKQAGNYYVTVTDANGCTAQSNHISVYVYPPVSVSISEYGDTLSAHGDFSYQWYLNGEAIGNATDSIFIATQPGSYTVQVTDSNGCTAFSNLLVITGINNLTEPNISLFPNPTSDKWQLTVDNSLLGSKLEVFDDNGKTVYESQISNLKTEIDFNAASGVYLLRISGDRVSAVRKLVKL